ncbi:MAG: hypothetical protein V3U03_06815 [Myxococcota bacterium]
MAHATDDATVVHPEVITLHWEGPPRAQAAPEHVYPDSADEVRLARAAERERELRRLRRTETGRALWEQIRVEAGKRGDAELWSRKLHAYWWVKLEPLGTAGDYARRFDANHATVRTWISEVAKLAYQVGYRLHEDRLLLVGEAPPGLQRLREFVNRDAASPAAWQALKGAESEFRGRDPYFHLNEGHVLRARRQLRESDQTLEKGLAIAEARSVRSLLWNARGQTFWDCRPDSAYPLRDHLEQAEQCFRRAAVVDQSTYFPFVNLAHMAVDAVDLKRTEYWIGELGSARKRMDETMQKGLVRYLVEAEWSKAVEGKKFWRNGPARWLREAAKAGLLTLALLCLSLSLATPPASGAAPPYGGIDSVAHGGKRGGGGHSGAGGN